MKEGAKLHGTLKSEAVQFLIKTSRQLRLCASISLDLLLVVKAVVKL